MSKIFKLEDIKAGYLLRVRNLDEDKTIHMTVLPIKGMNGAACLLFEILGETIAEDGELACCGDGRYWPLYGWDDDLEMVGDPYKFNYRVEAVYGYATPKCLLDNSPEGRELLWEREGVDQPAEVKKMTRAEIIEALGYDVEIVNN